MRRKPSDGRSKCWIGIDGTRIGWSVAILSEHSDSVQLVFARTLRDVWLLNTQWQIEAIAVDMPLSLAEHAERGGRACDRAARTILSACRRNRGRRSSDEQTIVGPSSIFTPPARPALHVFRQGASHTEVSKANINSAEGAERVTKRQKAKQAPEQTLGLGLSIQTFHILPKIAELDHFIDEVQRNDVLRFLPDHDGTKIGFFECHPEIAFLALSASALEHVSLERISALHSKKTVPGRRERLDLLLQAGVQGVGSHLGQEYLATSLSARATWALTTIEAHLHPESDVKNAALSVPTDDVLDSIVCALSAKRFAQSNALAIEGCETDDSDHRGIPRIIYV